MLKRKKCSKMLKTILKFMIFFWYFFGVVVIGNKIDIWETMSDAKVNRKAHIENFNHVRY